MRRQPSHAASTCALVMSVRARVDVVDICVSVGSVCQQPRLGVVPAQACAYAAAPSQWPRPNAHAHAHAAHALAAALWHALSRGEAGDSRVHASPREEFIIKTPRAGAQGARERAPAPAHAGLEAHTPWQQGMHVVQPAVWSATRERHEAGRSRRCHVVRRLGATRPAGHPGVLCYPHHDQWSKLGALCRTCARARGARQR